MSKRRASLSAAAAWVALAVVGPLLSTGSPAAATEPLELHAQISDRAGVLGDDEPRVRRALDRFYERTGLRLHVVYVRSFDGMNAEAWTRETATKSGMGPYDILLAFAQKNRAFGHLSHSPDLTATDLQAVDDARIGPALVNDDYAQATIQAADAYGDFAVDAGLPWKWIVPGLVIIGLGVWAYVLRSRRRFDHTHHVVDEHGRPVDPAQILTLPEIAATSAAALVAVDDALLTAAADVRRAAEQLGADHVGEFQQIVDDGRDTIDEAFRLRHKLDKLVARGTFDDDAKRKWRKRASRIIALCEEADASLDARTEDFDQARGLRKAAEERLTTLTDEVAQVSSRVPAASEQFAALSPGAAWAVTGNVELATDLLAAAEAQLERRDHAATRVRVIEDATSTASLLLDAIADMAQRSEPMSAADLVADVERYVTTRRGAVGVQARTLRSEAVRHLKIAESAVEADVADARRTSALADARAGLEAAITDVSRWQASRAAHDERHGRKFDALVLSGVLVDETESGGLTSLLGGSSHGGGSGAPYRGVDSGGTQRTAGSFGGTTTRGRHGAFAFSGSPAKMST